MSTGVARIIARSRKRRDTYVEHVGKEEESNDGRRRWAGKEKKKRRKRKKVRKKRLVKT